MNKSWRLTAVFGALFAVAAGLYFFTSPTATTPIAEMDPRVLDLRSDQVTKLEVDRKVDTLTFERTSDALGEYWRIAGPSSHPAEDALVQQMLYGLDRFLKAGALDPVKPESSPELTGLSDPRITVTFTAAGRREVLKFGKSPPTNSTVVCYQHQGDPKIYLVSVDTFESYNKASLLYRSKTLARYAPHRINKVVLEYKFLRPQGKDKPVLVEYEKSVMERFEEGMERGWYLTEPHRERLDDHAVAALVTELSRLQAAEYQTPGSPKEQGFLEPQAKVSLFSSGEDKPVEIHFGESAARGKMRWVKLAGAGEVALYDSFRYDELPLQRNLLRNRVIFAFSQELVKKLEIEVKDLGRVVLERREIKKPDEPVATMKWEVTEPKGLRVESERLEAFVPAVVSQQVENFLGAQDFKQAGLDPGQIRLMVETREGKKHTCWFSAAGYLRREGVEEVFQVRPEFVKLLLRLELNFLNMEMFNIPRQSLRGISFESRVSAELQPIYYRLELQNNQEWKFTDPAHKDAEVDPGRVADLVALMNYIRAESLIARDVKTIEQYRLDEHTAPSTLKIIYETGAGKDTKTVTEEVYISEDLSNKPTLQMYYARLKDNLTVFQINSLFVASLKQVPVLKKTPKEDGGK